MGTFAESVRKREADNRNAVKQADNLLRGELHSSGRGGSTAQDVIEDAYHALGIILARYDCETIALRRCSSVEDMLCSMLEPHGIMFMPVSIEEGEWRKQGQCILAFKESGEAVALTPSVTGFRYSCPSTGDTGNAKRGIALKDEAYVIFRPYEEESLTYGLFVRHLLKLTTPRDWLAILAMTALISLLGLAAPAFNAWVLEDLVPQGEEAYQVLAVAAMLFLTVELVSGACTALKSITLSSLRVRLERDIQGAYLARALAMPLPAFRNQSTGLLSSQMKNCARLVSLTVDLLFVTSVTALFSLVYIPQMTSIAPTLLVPALIILCLEFALSVAAALLYADNRRKALSVESRMHGEVFATIRGIGKLKSAGALSRAYGRWAKSYRKILELNHEPALLVKLQPIIPTFMSSLSTLVLYAVAFPAGITAAEFIAFSASFALATATVRQVIRFTNSASNIVPLVEQIRPMFETPVDNSGALEYVRQISGEIEIENAGFSYGLDSSFDLRDISLKISPGEKIAFVGPSGCGKSTLLRVVMGLEDLSEGRILFDGKPIDSLNRRSLSKQIGSVFQFSRVMPGTIRENVTFGSIGLTDDEVWEALDKAAIGDLVREMPQQLDTVISETAAGGFSGGQKQCLLLARAFARKPAVLVLDEATSALDNITQHRVIDSMHESQATVLMVAHRLSTVRRCDRIVVMDHGQVVETGTYEELVALDGLFSHLVAGQLADS